MVIMFFVFCLLTLVPFLVDSAGNGTSFQVLVACSESFSLPDSIFFNRKASRLNTSFIMKSKTQAKYFQANDQTYESCYDGSKWVCPFLYDYEFEENEELVGNLKVETLIRVYITQMVMWFRFKIRRHEENENQISDLTSTLFQKFPLPPQYFKPIKIHLVDSQINAKSLFFNLYEELKKSNQAIENAIRATANQDRKYSKFTDFLKGKVMIESVMKAIAANDLLVQKLNEELLKNALGPFIVFLARLLEELNSPTSLSSLITEDAYKYLEQHGQVYLVNSVTSFTANFNNLKMEAIDLVFDSINKTPITKNTNFSLINEKWNDKMFKSFEEELSFREAALVQLFAFAMLLRTSLPKDQKLSLSDHVFPNHEDVEISLYTKEYKMNVMQKVMMEIMLGEDGQLNQEYCQAAIAKWRENQQFWDVKMEMEDSKITTFNGPYHGLACANWNQDNYAIVDLSPPSDRISMTKDRFVELETLFKSEHIKRFGLQGLHRFQLPELFLFKIIFVLYRFGGVEHDEIFGKEIVLPINQIEFDSYNRIPIELFYDLTRQLLNQCEQLSKFMFSEDHVFFSYEHVRSLDDFNFNSDPIQIVPTIGSNELKCHVSDISKMLSTVFTQSKKAKYQTQGLKKKLTFEDKDGYKSSVTWILIPELILKIKHLVDLGQKAYKKGAECFYNKFQVYSFLRSCLDLVQRVFLSITKQDFFKTFSNITRPDGAPAIQVDTFRIVIMLVGGVFPLELIDLAIENLEEISSLVLLVLVKYSKSKLGKMLTKKALDEMQSEDLPFDLKNVDQELEKSLKLVNEKFFQKVLLFLNKDTELNIFQEDPTETPPPLSKTESMTSFSTQSSKSSKTSFLSKKPKLPSFLRRNTSN